MGYKAYFAPRNPSPVGDDAPVPSPAGEGGEGGETGAISPAHYSRFAIQPIDFIAANRLGFEAGNVVKYVCRFDAKNGTEDLMKARQYLDFLIKRELGFNPSDESVGV